MSQQKELDKIQNEAEKLVLLLRDRQTGLVSWHHMLYERMESLCGLWIRALRSKKCTCKVIPMSKCVRPSLEIDGDCPQHGKHYK